MEASAKSQDDIIANSRTLFPNAPQMAQQFGRAADTKFGAQTRTVESFVTAVVRDNRFTFFGEPEHDSSSLLDYNKKMADPAMFKGFAAGGAKHYLYESPVEYQGVVDDYYNQRITRDQFIDKFYKFVSLKDQPENIPKLQGLVADMIDEARKNGIKFHLIDTSPDDKVDMMPTFAKYFPELMPEVQKTLESSPGYNPKQPNSPLQLQAFLDVAEKHKINPNNPNLEKMAKEYSDIQTAARFDDRSWEQRIREVVPEGEKAVGYVGNNHLNNIHGQNGIDDLLSNGGKLPVATITIFADKKEEQLDAPGQEWHGPDKSDYTWRSDTDMIKARNGDLFKIEGFESEKGWGAALQNGFNSIESGFKSAISGLKM